MARPSCRSSPSDVHDDTSWRLLPQPAHPGDGVDLGLHRVAHGGSRLVDRRGLADVDVERPPLERSDELRSHRVVGPGDDDGAAPRRSGIRRCS